jgi:hypothetical protein
MCKPGTDVMIKKKICRKIGVFCSKQSQFMQNINHNIGFWEKRQLFRRKLSKIAENCQKSPKWAPVFRRVLPDLSHPLRRDITHNGKKSSKRRSRYHRNPRATIEEAKGTLFFSWSPPWTSRPRWPTYVANFNDNIFQLKVNLIFLVNWGWLTTIKMLLLI